MSSECSEPTFCFTSDLDWAPESMTNELVNFFIDEHIPLSPFVTHSSDVIRRHYNGKKMKHVGLHPNFATNTTHGDDVDSVISNTIKFWPSAKCFRSHYYVDSLIITQKLYNLGFKYDSNTCSFLQPNITPQNLASGLLRFPVFFEDIIYVDKTNNLRLRPLVDRLMTSGLKIFNIHPIHFCINTPSSKYYDEHRDELYSQKNWRSLVYQGEGIKKLLMGIIDFIKDHGLKTLYLEELYQTHRKKHEGGGLSSLLMKKALGDSR